MTPQQTSPKGLSTWVILLGLTVLVIGLPLAATAINAPPWAKPASWIQTDKLTPQEATEPGWNDKPNHHFARFGSSLDTHDKRLIVAAYGVDSAYIFDWTGDGWEQTGSIESDNKILSGSNRADDVAIYEDIAVVGAARASYLGMSNHGAAFIYEETDGWRWEKVATIAEGEDDNDMAGLSVAAEEDTIVVGVPQTENGNVHIYERIEGEWLRVETFTGPHRGSVFGATVEIHGDTILAGSPSSSGIVNVYDRMEDGWEHTTTLMPKESTTSFGFSIDMDDNLAIIGAAYSSRLMDEELDGTANMGKAFIYENSENGWGMIADLDSAVPIPHDPYIGLSPGARFGTDVAIQGDTAVVGAPFTMPNRAGAAYVYERVVKNGLNLDEGEWERAERLMYNETYIGDWMGHSVEIEGDSILVGTPFDNNRRDVPIYPFSARGHYPGIGSNGNMAGSVYEYRPNPIHEMLDDQDL